MRGRYPSGLEVLEEMEGSAEDKERLQTIVETMMGQTRVLEACERLGIGETRFRQLRGAAMQGALDAIRPKPAGRPSRAATPEAERIRELEQQFAEKELELQQAQVRAEVALILPHVAGDEGKKTRRPSVKLRKLKPR
jgi:hypothetical protein